MSEIIKTEDGELMTPDQRMNHIVAIHAAQCREVRCQFSVHGARRASIQVFWGDSLIADEDYDYSLGLLMVPYWME